MRRFGTILVLVATIIVASFGTASAQSPAPTDYDGTAGYELAPLDDTLCEGNTNLVDLEWGTPIQTDTFIVLELPNHDPGLTSYDNEQVTHLFIWFEADELGTVDRVSRIEASAKIWSFSEGCESSNEAYAAIVGPYVESLVSEGFVPEMVESFDPFWDTFYYEVFPEPWMLES